MLLYVHGLANVAVELAVRVRAAILQPETNQKLEVVAENSLINSEVCTLFLPSNEYELIRGSVSELNMLLRTYIISCHDGYACLYLLTHVIPVMLISPTSPIMMVSKYEVIAPPCTKP